MKQVAQQANVPYDMIKGFVPQGADLMGKSLQAHACAICVQEGTPVAANMAGSGIMMQPSRAPQPVVSADAPPSLGDSTFE